MAANSYDYSNYNAETDYYADAAEEELVTAQLIYAGGASCSSSSSAEHLELLEVSVDCEGVDASGNRTFGKWCTVGDGAYMTITATCKFYIQHMYIYVYIYIYIYIYQVIDSPASLPTSHPPFSTGSQRYKRHSLPQHYDRRQSLQRQKVRPPLYIQLYAKDLLLRQSRCSTVLFRLLRRQWKLQVQLRPARSRRCEQCEQ